MGIEETIKDYVVVVASAGEFSLSETFVNKIKKVSKNMYAFLEDLSEGQRKGKEPLFTSTSRPSDTWFSQVAIYYDPQTDMLYEEGTSVHFAMIEY